ncbi:MAG: hypothetical protein K5853_08725 [Lachnospiraceae bacterium]|nr:hypothetical protein [Lachnospiraceae bacterium]
MYSSKTGASSVCFDYGAMYYSEDYLQPGDRIEIDVRYQGCGKEEREC